jgi:hypothetical protein
MSVFANVPDCLWCAESPAEAPLLLLEKNLRLEWRAKVAERVN